MGNTWQLQDAKNKLSELIDYAVSGEPQTISQLHLVNKLVIAGNRVSVGEVALLQQANFHWDFLS